MTNSHDIKDFNALKVLLASPEDIQRWSRGEVTKPETINYRTGRPEVDGLMCEKIFGPTKNYQCYCGKYRKPRYKGIVCDKCGVEVTLSKVRREWMGHINLVIPVVHVWYIHSVPSKIAVLLDVPQKDLEAVAYYTRFIVVDIDETKREESIKNSKQYFLQLEKDLKDEMELRLADLEKEKKDEISQLSKKKLSKEKYIVQEGIINEKYLKLAGEVRKDINQEIEDNQKVQKKNDDLIRKLSVYTILTDDDHSLLQTSGANCYTAMIGADAVKYLLSKLDLPSIQKELKERIVTSAGKLKIDDIRRLKYVTSMINNNIQPVWMIINALPVIPPDLRPIISLPGGRFAVSDLNDLYRRVINRNNRLKRLIEINAPEVILRNEKRMLQEAVDSLIDNEHTPHKPVLNSKRLPYKSLTDQLRGKKGRFRRNLLGKRVDYSGRAVIIGDPTLTLRECGLPRDMAIELFKPFIIHKLMKSGNALNINEAKLMINEKNPAIFDALTEILKERPILLNRPPTLHKQSVQGFYAKLVDGNAIRLHPLVCSGYNADFDGDQMGVFIPLSSKTIEEINNKMLAKYNILRLADGDSIISLAKDTVWGIYYLTSEMLNKDKLTPKVYSSKDDAVGAYEKELIKLQHPIVVEINGEIIRTTVGRILFNECLPTGHPYINELMSKGKVNDLVSNLTDSVSPDELTVCLDKLKDLGFKYATQSGFSISKLDLISYKKKDVVLEKASKNEEKIFDQYNMGLITQNEKERLIQELWLETTEKLAQDSWEELKNYKENSIYLQIETKTSGSLDNLKQVVAIKGLVRDPSGKWVNLPIRSNYTDGLSVFEFFIAARGGRKGLADTALRTADSGYLTRKLVDATHTSIIRQEDCGYNGEGIEIRKNVEREISYINLIKGRTLSKDIINQKSKKIIISKNEIITREKAIEIDSNEEIKSIWVRSPLTCNASMGICSKCYGNDMGTNKPVKIGTAVGVIASQSIGEASTQMTLRTFHFGGSKARDITQGVPKLVELFEARTPKYSAKVSPIDGKLNIKVGKVFNIITVEGTKEDEIKYIIDGIKELKVKDGDKVNKNDDLFIIDNERKVIAVRDGKVQIEGKVLTFKSKLNVIEKFKVNQDAELLVKNNENVIKGQKITQGSIPPKEYSEIVGNLTAQLYILEELQKVYRDQGIPINDKHLEVVLREMGRTAKIIHPGDSDYVIGDIGNKYMMDLKNMILIEKSKDPIVYKTMFVGIAATSLNADGILSALSFQEQVRILTDRSLRGEIDFLRGLKENVIIGRKIPTGDEAALEEPNQMEEIKSMIDNL